MTDIYIDKEISVSPASYEIVAFLQKENVTNHDWKYIASKNINPDKFIGTKVTEFIECLECQNCQLVVEMQHWNLFVRNHWNLFIKERIDHYNKVIVTVTEQDKAFYTCAFQKILSNLEIIANKLALYDHCNPFILRELLT